MTVEQITAVLRDGGAYALLVLVLWGGIKQAWVFGWVYRSVCDERDDWRRAALTGTDAAARVTTLIEERRRP
jgi:hypothetical protein